MDLNTGKDHMHGLTDLPYKLERGLVEATITSTEMRKSSHDGAKMRGNKSILSVNQITTMVEASVMNM